MRRTLHNVYWTKKLLKLSDLVSEHCASNFHCFCLDWDLALPQELSGVFSQLSHSVTARGRVELRTLTPAVVRVLLVYSLCVGCFATLLLLYSTPRHRVL